MLFALNAMLCMTFVLDTSAVPSVETVWDCLSDTATLALKSFCFRGRIPSRAASVLKPLKRCNTPLLGLVKGNPPKTQVGALHRATAGMAPGARVCLTVYHLSRRGLATPFPPGEDLALRGRCDVRGLDA